MNRHSLFHLLLKFRAGGCGGPFIVGFEPNDDFDVGDGLGIAAKFWPADARGGVGDLGELDELGFHPLRDGERCFHAGGGRKRRADVEGAFFQFRYEFTAEEWQQKQRKSERMAHGQDV